MKYESLEDLIRDNPANQEVYELIITIRTVARQIASHTTDAVQQCRCEFIAANCTEIIDAIRKVQKDLLL